MAKLFLYMVHLYHRWYTFTVNGAAALHMVPLYSVHGDSCAACTQLNAGDMVH